MTKAEMKRCVKALCRFDTAYYMYDDLAEEFRVSREEFDPWNPRALWCLKMFLEQKNTGKDLGFPSFEDVAWSVEASMLLSEVHA